MGQNISVDVRFASEKRCVSFSIDCSTKYSIIDSGFETTEFFFNLFMDILSTKYPEEVFMVNTESTRDFENFYKDWYIVQNGRYTHVKNFVDYRQEDSNDKQEGDEENPDWFVEHENRTFFHGIHYMTDYATNSVYFYGEFTKEDNNLFLDIANEITEETGSLYVQYDVHDKYCLHNKVVVPISSLSEKDQEKYFERKPVFVNKTSVLFSPLHPELLAVYGNKRDAKKGYDKGEFALYETSEGMKFYSIWRNWSKVNTRWDKNKNNNLSLFLLLGHSPIDATSVDVSPLYKKAQQDFLVGAIQYKDAHYNRYFGALYGDRYGELEHKIIKLEDGTLQQVMFSLSDFYPI